eukprot:gene67-45_t
MVATLNNHSICLWDTSRPTSTLSDFQFFRDTVTYAFDWSPLNPSLFATAGTNGFISIWDKRTSLSHPAGAAFVGKRVVQHLSWSRFSDIELAALVNDEFILKWDARVISDQVADTETKPRYSILQCNEPTIDVAWKDDSSFWLLSAESISQLKADNECVAFPISVGDRDNTTQSFIWNPSQRLCAILSSRKSTCDTIINFFRVENGACWSVDNLAIPGRPAHCFWRQHEDVFVVVTLHGYLRFFDLNTQSRSVILSHESNAVEEDYFLGRQSYENRWFVGGGDVTRSMYGDLKSLGLVDHSHERAFLEHSAREQLHQHQYHLTMGATLKNVVGPRTFYMLLSDELRALEQALKTRMLEGVVLTGCDAFNRMLSLDCNMAANTPGSGPIIRTFSMLYNVDHSNNNHIITLTISFPKKQSHFWNMNFTIENRSHHKLDVELLKSDFVKEVQDATLLLVRGRSRSNSIGGGGATGGAGSGAGSTASSSTATASTTTTTAVVSGGLKAVFPNPLPASRSKSLDYSAFILFNVARIFRDKAQHHWDAALAAERRMSNSGFSHSADHFRFESDGTGDDSTDGEGRMSGGGGGNGLVGGGANERRSNAQKAHRTPFPVLSGAVFNSKGALVMFGNASLSTGDYQAFQQRQQHHRWHRALASASSAISGAHGSDFVQDIPHKYYLHPTHVSSLPEAAGSKRNRHVSYAALVSWREERERLATQQLGLSSGAKGLRPMDTIAEASAEAKAAPDASVSSDDDGAGEHSGRSHDGDDSGADSDPAAAQRKLRRRQGRRTGAGGQHSRSPNVAVIDAILEKGERAMRREYEQQQQQQLQDAPPPPPPDKAVTQSPRLAPPASSVAPSGDGSIAVDSSAASTATAATAAAPLKPPPLPLALPMHSSLTASSSSTSAAAAAASLHPPRRLNTLRVTSSLFPQMLELASRYVLSGVASASPSATLTLPPPPPTATGSPTSVTALSPGHRTDSLVAACRLHAQLVADVCPRDHALQQFWHLLSVALDVYQIAETEADLIRWSDSALGRNLLHRLVHYLVQRRDVQTWATLLALLGGAETLCRLLYGASATSPRGSFSSPLPESYASTPWVDVDVASLDVFSYVYVQCLQRWSLDLQAMQVRQSLWPSSSMASAASSTSALAAPGGASSSRRNSRKKGMLESQHVASASLSPSAAMHQLLLSGGCQSLQHTLSTQTLCLRKRIRKATSGPLVSATTSSGTTATAATAATHRRGASGPPQSASHPNAASAASTGVTPTPTPHVSGDHSMTAMTAAGGAHEMAADGAPRCQVAAMAVAMPCVVCLSTIDVDEATLVTLCLRCGHGGHDRHLRAWFAVEDECPAACGCMCRQWVPQLLPQLLMMLSEAPGGGGVVVGGGGDIASVAVTLGDDSALWW